MPACLNASILSPAAPLPPEMMAPAWPIRRPGGGGHPGDETDDGLLRFRSFDEGCGVFLGSAADFADHDDALGLVVGEEGFEAIDEIGCR